MTKDLGGPYFLHVWVSECVCLQVCRCAFVCVYINMAYMCFHVWSAYEWICVCMFAHMWVHMYVHADGGQRLGSVSSFTVLYGGSLT